MTECEYVEYSFLESASLGVDAHVCVTDGTAWSMP